MLSKEEIEKAKKWLAEHIDIQKRLDKLEMSNSERATVYTILSNYIQQLETKVKELEEEKQEVIEFVNRLDFSLYIQSEEDKAENKDINVLINIRNDIDKILNLYKEGEKKDDK